MSYRNLPSSQNGSTVVLTKILKKFPDTRVQYQWYRGFLGGNPLPRNSSEKPRIEAAPPVKADSTRIVPSSGAACCCAIVLLPAGERLALSV
eukprot:626279-Rhodomonas_salina.2